jgi:CheY-like chemotaxis protein
MIAVVVGEFSQGGAEQARVAVLEADAEPALYWDADDAREGLSDDGRPVPRCVFLDAASVDTRAFLTWMRAQPALFPIPVVVMLPDVSDAAFKQAHQHGADDAMSIHDTTGMTRRIAQLAEFDPLVRPPPTRGRVVIACAEDRSRVMLGRILRIGGFDVAFARTAADIHAAGREGVELVVATRHLAPEGAVDAIRKLRAGCGRDVPAVLLAPPGDPSDLGDDARELGRAVASSEDAPPDNLLFLANELLLPDVINKRESARILHSTLCSFRAAGSLRSSFGLTYNVSAGGLYVRTLDPLARGTTVWLELDPALGEAVQLRGEVVWRQGMSNNRGAPTGFGVRLEPSACVPSDLARYVEGYRRIAAKTG